MFSSFIQAGFECSTHKLKNGRRLDLVSSTCHDRFVARDYRSLLNLRIRTVREGLRWHLIEPEPAVRDFSSALPMVRAAQECGIQIIWDLFHFGWPDHLDVFSPESPAALGDLAFDFMRLLKKEMSGALFIAPVNEISFVSWAGGDTAYLNPFAKGRGAELKRQLVRGAILASQAVRSEYPEALLVSPEPAIHIVGDPGRPKDVENAEAYRQAMFEAWDMLAGRAQPELGGREEYLQILGVNYYDRNQWWNFGETICRNDPHYRPFHHILIEISQRYQRPLMISETGTENKDRPAWFAYVAQEVRQAIAAGVPMHGICLYPILNHPGWDDDRHCHNGLWDYPASDGSREIYQPLADEIEQMEFERSEATI